MDLEASESTTSGGGARPGRAAGPAKGRLSPRAALRLKRAVVLAAAALAISLGAGLASVAGRLLEGPPAREGRRISLRELETLLSGPREERPDTGR